MAIEPKHIFAHEPGYKEYINGEISFEEFFAMIDASSPSEPLSPEDTAKYQALADYYSSSEHPKRTL